MSSSYQLTCLCGAIQEPIRCSKAADFPFPTSLCHCNPCRQSSGALYTALPRLTAAPSAKTLALCTLYASLGPTGLQRYFCTRCGTHVCLLDIRDGEWHGSGGAIEPVGANPATDHMRVTGHIFANDPQDGGIVGARPGLVAIPYGADHPAEQPCFDEWKEGPRIPYAPLHALASAPSSLAPPAATDTLVAKCHCGGTDLRIRRADYARDTQGMPAENIPPEKDKYMALHCACRSCRLGNGVSSLQPWSSMPTANITVAATGKQVVFGDATKAGDTNEGTTMKHFWSSERVCWTFCGRCGASLFYWNKKRPESTDIAVGVLRADEGSLAKRWLWWSWDEVSYEEEAVDHGIYRAIKGETKES